MKKTAILVMVITIFSKVLGFVRDITLTSVLGMSGTADAFQVAISIPSVVLTVVGAAFVSGIIPMLSRISKEDPERGHRFTSNVMNIMLVFSAILSIFMFVVPELAVKMVAWGSTGASLQMAASFVRIIAFGVFAVSIVQLGGGYLNVMESFLIPAFVGIPANIIIISAIVLSGKMDQPIYMAYGQLIGLLLQAAIIYMTMRKKGFSYRPIIDLKDEDLRAMVHLAFPLVVSSLLGQLNGIVMKGYATKIYSDEGVYTYMSNADKLVAFVQGIFTTSILSVTYPTISHAVASSDHKRVNKSINDAILMLAVFIIPAMIGFVFLSREIVSFVYLRGKVTAADINILAPIFFFNSMVLFSHAIRELFYRISYAYQDMISPVKNTVFFSGIFVVLMVIMATVFQRWDMPLAGLTFAFALATTATIYPMWRSLQKHLHDTEVHIIIPDFIKIVISSVVMALAIVFSRPILTSLIGSRLSLFAIIGVSGLAYIASLLVLKTGFVMSLISSFKKR